MKRDRGRFGLPALTTPEAFAFWVFLVVTSALLLLAVGAMFDVALPGFVIGLTIWLPLLFVMATPKKRKRADR